MSVVRENTTSQPSLTRQSGGSFLPQPYLEQQQPTQRMSGKKDPMEDTRSTALADSVMDDVEEEEEEVLDQDNERYEEDDRYEEDAEFEQTQGSAEMETKEDSIDEEDVETMPSRQPEKAKILSFGGTFCFQTIPTSLT